MTETSRQWRQLAEIAVPAKPVQGIWTPVLDYVTGPVILRITATGKWQPADILPGCSADGHRHWAFGRDLLLSKDAPLGALIGKIGGSNAGTSDSAVFLVGTYAVVTVDKQAGPLYLTINDAGSGFDDNSGELQVKIEMAD